MNIADAIEEHARAQPDAPALIDPAGRMGYRRLAGAVRGLAAELAASGIAPGQVVAVVVSTPVLHFLTLLALARLGAVSLALHPKMRGEKLRRIAESCGISSLVAQAGVAAPQGVRAIRARVDWLRGAAAEAPRYEAAPEDLWCLALTSGTTGAPKAVARSHGEFLRLSALQRPVTGIGPASRFLCAMSQYTMAITVRALNHLHAGGALVFPDAIETPRALQCIERQGVTHTFASPAMLSKWLRLLPEGHRPFRTLSHLLVGGGHLPQAQRREVIKRICPHIFVTYGTTETGFIALADRELLERDPGSAGRLFPWVQAQAVDEHDRPLPAGETGVLRFRGEGVASGYHGAQPTGGMAKAFRGGWCYPGDVGRVTAEGILHIEERIDDVVSVAGVKVSTTKVEGMLLTHPSVAEAAAFSLVLPRGEAVLVAAVVPRGALDAKELLRYYKEKGGACAWLLRICAVRALPRNAMGKVMKKELAGSARVRATGRGA